MKRLSYVLLRIILEAPWKLALLEFILNIPEPISLIQALSENLDQENWDITREFQDSGWRKMDDEMPRL